MDPVLVVGAGISGLACARTLLNAGVPVTVLDRGRVVGGRMASRTLADRVVDTGASYLTVSDPGFGEVVADWAARGLARPWTDTFEVIEDGAARGPKQGSTRWAAPGGLRALLEDLARGLDVRRHVDPVTEVRPGADGTLLVDDRPARAVVLAMPDPQARRLLHPDLAQSRAALDDPFAPVLALAAGWDRRHWRADLHGAFVNGDPALSWLADDGSRRGDGAPVLVGHSTAELAVEHLADPQAAAPVLTEALTRLLGIPQAPDWTHLHRWSFAHPTRPKGRTHHLDDAGIGLCGDAWSDRPRVEAAWLSGVALGRDLAGRC